MSCDPLEITEKLLEEIENLKADKEALINGQETLQKYLVEKMTENVRLKDEIKICRDALGEEIDRANKYYKDSVTYKTALDSVCKELNNLKEMKNETLQ